MAMAWSDHLRRRVLESPARACFAGCGSPPVSLVLLPRSSRLTAPFNRVGERGAWASGFIVARRGRIVLGADAAAACFGWRR